MKQYFGVPQLIVLWWRSMRYNGGTNNTFRILLVSPLQFGPQRQAPKNSLINQSLLSRVGSYLLQNQEPSTAKIYDKENSCFLQNQEPHMWKHQNKSKNITCWVKTSKDDSVEICRDVLLIFDFVAWMCLHVLQVLQVPSKVPKCLSLIL